jgi:hypothetical protein
MAQEIFAEGTLRPGDHGMTKATVASGFDTRAMEPAHIGIADLIA